MGSRYSNSWQGTGDSKAVITDTVPAGTAFAYVNLELSNASGTVWFDGAQLIIGIAVVAVDAFQFAVSYSRAVVALGVMFKVMFDFILGGKIFGHIVFTIEL